MPPVERGHVQAYRLGVTGRSGSARTITFALVSRAPYERRAAFRERMGWPMPLHPSDRFTFNHDLSVTLESAPGREIVLLLDIGVGE